MKTRPCFRVAAVLALAATLVPLVSAQAPREKDKKDKPSRVVHEVRLSGAYQDLPGLSLGLTDLLAGGVNKPKGFYQLVADLKAVAKEKGGELLVDLSESGFSVNDAQVAELERAFEALRAANIKTTAYLENASTRHYLVACLCDKIVLADVALLDFAAPSMSVMFFKDALDLLGVQFQATRMGDFKGAVEPYVLSEMSGHLRAHYLDMVTSMNARDVKLISERRKMAAEKVRELQARRMIPAKAAQEAGLVDEIVAWQGAHHALGGEKACAFESIGKKKDKKGGFSFMSLLTGGGKDEKKVDEDSLVVLHLSGVIVDGEKDSPGQIVSGPTVSLIRKLAANEFVHGMVVRVNSPGGSGTASEAILLALRAFAEKKPVAISMGSVAASGGYFVSMVGGTVFAEHNTITGSIGVFGMRPNVSALARRIGVRNEIIALDETAATMVDPFRPLQDAQLKQIEAFIRDFYERFRHRILEARKNLNDEQLLAIAGGRVWSGQQALGLGLVDKIGGLDDALAVVRKKVGVEDLPVVTFPEADASPFKMFESLLEGESILDRGRLELLKAAGFDLSQSLALTLDALRNPGMPRAWMLMPCELVVR